MPRVTAPPKWVTDSDPELKAWKRPQEDIEALVRRYDDGEALTKYERTRYQRYVQQRYQPTVRQRRVGVKRGRLKRKDELFIAALEGIEQLNTFITAYSQSPKEAESFEFRKCKVAPAKVSD